MGLFTKLPRWATGGSAQITEPTEQKKSDGWLPGEKPPAQYENWKWKVLNDCLTVLDNLFNTAITWAARHTFNGGITVPTPTAATDAATKQYVDDHVTDAAGAHAASAIANTPAGNLAATTVQAALNELDTEKAALAGAAFTGAVSVQPASAAAHPIRRDQATGKLIKAWARLAIAASGAVTVISGVNVASASWSSATLTVNFTSPLADALYAIESIRIGGDLCIHMASNPQTSNFQIAKYGVASGALAAFPWIPGDHISVVVVGSGD